MTRLQYRFFRLPLITVLSIAACLPSMAQAPVLDTIAHAQLPRPLVLASLPAGSFTMGSPATEPGRQANEGPQRAVQLSAFAISIYETTWEQYNTFFQDAGYSVNTDVDAITRPSPPYLDFTLGMGKEGYPAGSMQPYGALMFCKWLYDKTGIFFRLPTEAEWEYACRAGSSTAYPWGADSSAAARHAWYAANSGGKYQKVGTLEPNAWGLYDMLGNVAEWVLDSYADDYFAQLTPPAQDPLRHQARRYPRTVRGGHYKDGASALRAAHRMPNDPIWNRRDPQIPKSKWWNTDANFVGFRVVRPAVQPSKEEVAEFFKRFLFQ